MPECTYGTEPWVQPIQRVQERSTQAQGSLMPAAAVTVPITAGHTGQAQGQQLARVALLIAQAGCLGTLLPRGCSSHLIHSLNLQTPLQKRLY